MARASLQGTPSLRRPSRSRKMYPGRLSFANSLTIYGTPSEGGHQTAKRRLSTEQPRSQKQCSWLRGRSRWRWHQALTRTLTSSLPSSPSPPRSSPPGEWLCLHMWDLKLQTRTWESGVGYSKVEAPPQLMKAQGESNATLMKNWVVNLHWLQAWLSSCLGERPLSDIPSLPLLQKDLLIHHSLAMKKAPSGVPPPTGGARPKVWSSATYPQLRPQGPDLVSHPCRWIHAEMLKIPTYPGGKPWCPVARGQYSLTSCTRSSMNQKPFVWLIGRQWCSSYPRPNRSSRMMGPSTHNPQASPWRQHAFPYFLLLLDNETAEDHGLS